uniref:Small ribosomal subunit protein uS17 n=2 Tax=environmental samples TaxID=58229 RepID=A0A0H4T6Y1_9CHLR|nr:30S ribosomal protein S17, small subunit ribosomal protein S17 [uncultured Chloroflexi bacterium Rifle_16ft_4_minimus_38099]AKQ05181.1 30S ribosomal protein S17, small subunit ribosomal protein S17 [uncultured Chloroflexi bacterium Rifle_16ft_4_minimus_28854]
MSNKRRRMTGVVRQAKLEKTIRVQVDQSYRHPLYQKVVRKSRQYLVHDEVGCRPGDQVIIVESRPISKLKRWSVESISRRATEEEVAAKTEELVEDVFPEAQE